MEQDQHIRSLVAAQLGLEIGDVNELPLVDVALALQDALGVALAREHLLRLGSYGDLLQALRGALAGRTDPQLDDGLSACFVRARVVAGGADGRVTIVRVGWLTPDLATAIADDVRGTPLGTWLDVMVPPDVSDGDLDDVRRGLRALVGSHVQLDVRRIGTPGDPLLGRIATAPRGQMSQRAVAETRRDVAGECGRAGTRLADASERSQCNTRRRTDR